MIASNQIRKGNALKLGDQVVFVSQILWNRLEVAIPAGKEKIYKEVTYEEVEPIQLTTEILDNCGMSKLEQFHFFNVYNLGNFTINQLRDSVEVSFGINTNPAIVAKGQIFLHQLQNLYFILTQEELPLQLPISLK